jgi:hypothetical protein
MSLNVDRIGVAQAQPMAKALKADQPQEPEQIKNPELLKQEIKDTVSFKGLEAGDGEGMSEADKKELVLKARTKASGYAFWFTSLSTLYYGLRSDKTVAKKYNLDPVEDKKLIKTIKRQQLLWTLPACIPGMNFISGAVAYLYNKNSDADKIDL